MKKAKKTKETKRMKELRAEFQRARSVNGRWRVWIKALRSGAFKQAEGALLVDGEGFCCLGVAEYLAGFSFDRRLVYRSELSLGVRDLLGLRDVAGQFRHSEEFRELMCDGLVDVNDEARIDFLGIADFLASKHGREQLREEGK
jgi:hypothetical protein